MVNLRDSLVREREVATLSARASNAMIGLKFQPKISEFRGLDRSITCTGLTIRRSCTEPRGDGDLSQNVACYSL